MHRTISLKEKGMTLVELMVTMFLAILMIAVGLPAFLELRQSQTQSSSLQKTYGIIQFARSLAMTEATRVTFCPSTNMSTCSNTTNYADGAIVTSRESDGSETLVRVIDEISIENFIIDLVGFPSLTAIEFNDTGEINNLATTASIRFCDPRGSEAGAALIVTPLGMVRLATDDDDNRLVNLHDQTDIVCAN